MSFTKQILLGLFLGIAAGIFFGELAAPLSTLGNAFIGLLQMTVLPYIMVSLVANLGRVSWSDSRGLLLAAVSMLGLLLFFGMLMLLVIPVAFPEWHTGSFFRSSLVEPARAVDLVALYIPANPFNSMANNVVPAVVLFSILLGIGVSGVSGNGGFINALMVLEAGLNRINKIVIKLTPLGVFAIAAATAGTLSLNELSRLQTYLITYTVVAIVLSFVVLPLFVSAVTPFRYRDLVAIPKATLIMIFATAKIIVLMPQLVDNVKELYQRYKLQDEKTDSGAEVLLPLAYPFPNLGTYIILMFVPFSAWYMGRSLDVSDQLMFQGASLLSSFVAPIIGIPFLLDLMRIPADMMELFVMSTVYTDRIRVVLGAVHLLSLTVVALAIVRGQFRLHWGRLLRAAAISIVVLGVSLLAVRVYLDQALEQSYSGDQALVQMRWMDRTVPVKFYSDTLPEPVAGDTPGGRLALLRERGSLRVGYLPDALPFAFVNKRGEVVGFDIELAHRLASDLGVTLELVRMPFERIGEYLNTGVVDIVMSGLAITPQRALQWNFSASPIDLTLAMLVPDHRRKEFVSLSAINRISDLKIGAVQSDSGFLHLLESAFPGVDVTYVSSPRSFLRGEMPELDAVIYSAEGGSAWTLIYPGYSIVVPQPGVVKLPTGFPLPDDDREWQDFVSEWVEIKQKEGTVNALFEHWIMGRGAEDTAPRWSIVRDVLHWVE